MCLCVSTCQIAVVEVDETEQLYEDTRSIYERYDPHRVKPIRNLVCDRSAAAQAVFSAAVKTGWETHGIELDEPTYQYMGCGKPVKKSRSQQSMASVVSGDSIREDNQQMSAPKLPPREGRSSAEEKQR